MSILLFLDGGGFLRPMEEMAPSLSLLLALSFLDLSDIFVSLFMVC